MSTTRRAVASFVVVLCAVAGCSDAVEPDLRPGRPAATDVAGDESATAADVIAVGRVVDIAESGAGQLLVAYVAESDDDEGPQVGAWRLYDTAGEPVADGLGVRVSEESAQPKLTGLPDGFVIQPSPHRRKYARLDADGSIRPLPRGEPTPYVQSGDVLVGDGALVYRGATESLAVVEDVGRTVRASGQNQTLDDTDALWVLRSQDGQDRLTVARAGAGSTTWEETRIALQPGALPLGIATAGDQIAVPVARVGRNDVLDSVYLRTANAPLAERWRRLPAPVPRNDTWYTAAVFGLPAGRLLVGSASAAWYEVDPTTGDWTRLPLPDADIDFTVTVVGDRMYAYSSQPGTAYARDGDGSWEPLPR